MTTDNSDLSLVLGDHPIFQVPEDAVISDGEQTLEPETTGEQVTSQEDEEQFFIRLDRRDLQKQLLDFVNQDPDARQIYMRSVGNQAAKRYAPRIKELEEHVAALQQLRKRDEYGRLSQEEINEKFSSDPEFARDYAAIAHSTIQEPVVDTNAITRNLVEGIQNIVTIGQRQGLTEQDLQEMTIKLRSGIYDKDEFGNDLPPSMWREVLENVQEDVTNRIVKNRVGTALPATPTPEASQPATPTVTRTDTATPDLAPTGNRGTRISSMTMTQFKALPWDDQFTFLGDIPSVEEAVRRGLITLEGN